MFFFTEGENLRRQIVHVLTVEKDSLLIMLLQVISGAIHSNDFLHACVVPDMTISIVVLRVRN